MRAMVLAAGLGTRLGPLTADTPKPLLDASGRPILEWIVRHLRSQGFDRVGINLHHHGALIREHFGDGSELGLRELRYFEEPRLLGTAGALRNAAGFLGEEGPFVVQYGDVVTDHSVAGLLEFHASHEAEATMMVHERPGSNSVVAHDSNGLVTDFLERPDDDQRRQIPSAWAFSGICVLDPVALERIPASGASDLPRDIFPGLIADGALFASHLDGYRVAVDSPERLTSLRAAVAAGECAIDPA